jgi:uncharacterized glyoxalase superfamily protein PhnB
MIREHRFVIAVRDLAASSEFYRDVLGFDVQEMAPGWCWFASGACSIMAGECPDAVPASELGDHSYFAYLVVDRVDDYYLRATARRAEITKPLRDEPWAMREFGVRTVDGHRLMIGSPLS